MSLYLKYRPAGLDAIQGNEEVVQSLRGMLADLKTCPHSFLFVGPTGCGKTTLGRIVGKGVGAIGADFKEVDSADFRGIDTIRDIRKWSSYNPIESANGGTSRVWLIDECHKLTNDAQNALLKSLEDTPSHVYFILCTTDPQKLLPTIRGRCSTFQVKTLSDNQMMRLLRDVVKAEGETLAKPVYEQIIQDSLGHPRNALQILDQVFRVESELRLETAKRVAAEQSQSIELCRALLQNKSWKEISGILDGLKEQDPESIRRHVLGYCQAVLLKSDNTRAGLIMECFMEPTYNGGFPQVVFNCYSIVK